MHERIKAIMAQTNLHRNNHTTEERIEEVDKFADLVIEICAKLCRDNRFSTSEAYAHNILTFFGKYDTE